MAKEKKGRGGDEWMQVDLKSPAMVSEWDYTIKRFSTALNNNKTQKSRTWISLSHRITSNAAPSATMEKSTCLRLEPARLPMERKAEEKEKKEGKKQEPKTVLSHSRWNEKSENSETVRIVRAATWRFFLQFVRLNWVYVMNILISRDISMRLQN